MLRADVGAGVNVALLAIPQGMAYAMVAGMPHEATGIICSAVAAMIGAFFAASRSTILGPTNATALMVFSSLAGVVMEERVLMLPLLLLMTAVFLIAGAGLRLADLIQYISRSVVVGYITGSAVLIAAGQFREVLGIADTGRSVSFLATLADIIRDCGRVRPWAPLLAGATVLIYILLRRFAPRLPAFALALGISCLFAAGMNGHITMLHEFSPSDLLPNLDGFTHQHTLDFVNQLLGPAIAVAFLAALENTVMGKALSGRTGQQVDLNQDLLACGLANAACAFTGGMAASGSLTRSALNHASGARSGVSSLFCGLLCAGALFLLGPIMPSIPRAGLAALVICVALGLVNRRHLRICWRSTRSDATTLAITFASTLLMPLHVAIFAGVAVSVILYLRKAARPSLVEYEFTDGGDLQERHTATGRREPAISIVHVEGELFFGAAELFRTQIQSTATDENLRVIILRMKNARHLDATSVMALEDLIAFLRISGRHLLISGLSKEVYRVLKNSGMIDTVGRENLFIGSAQNPNLSTRNALRRAQQLLGTKQAEVRIFYDPSRPVE